MELYRTKQPIVLIIFGASGDLAKLKLFPALYSLAEQKRFGNDFHIIGFARSPKSQTAFKKEFEESIKKAHKDANPKIINSLTKSLHYFQGNYDDIKDFSKLHAFTNKLGRKKNLTKLAYFSIPPVAFKPIIHNLGKTRDPKEDIRLIIEKPFGQNMKSATGLFHYVARYFDENSVYLLDHYLGKTAVQSILSLRHSNRILNLMMKGGEVANIQITAFEDKGVTNRVGYFDQVGTIRDMVQSHLLQILALITMSIPITENARSLHREKYAILSALSFERKEKNIVLGQYSGYKKEKDVPKNSKTETFTALRLFIDRESWYQKPIYIRTGKKLGKKHTYIVIEIKKFGFQPAVEEPNRLIIELHPDEKISIRLVNKLATNEDQQVIGATESIACTGDDCLPEHALLLLDVMRENRVNFLSFNEIIATWQLTDEIVEFLKANKIKPETYADGSMGPQSQHKLTALDGFEWFDVHQ